VEIYRVHYQNDVLTLRLVGAIDQGNGAHDMRVQIIKLIAEGKKKLILGMAEVDRIDPFGLGELTSLKVRLKNAGGDLKMFGLRKNVKDLFTLTKLHVTFDLCETEAEALSLLAATA
jgi:anti-sigma B factor antagonist